jgi:NADH-quinone oxidoreductase subunit M
VTVQEFPWLTVLSVAPLVGAVVVALVPARRAVLAKQLALMASLAVLAIAIAMAVGFAPNGERFQFTERYAWIPSLGVSYAVGVDGIALALILLTAALVPILILSGWNDPEESVGGSAAQDAEKTPSVGVYFALVLVLEAMTIAQFAALDVFFFYVLFEAMLVPMYFLIGRYGGPQRSYAAVKFLLYNLLGGLVMLVAVVTLSFAGPGGEDGYLFENLVGFEMDATTQKWLFLAFFFAFAVKAPLWPLHTWLPDAAAEATPSNAVLLSGLLDKVGVFAMLRLCLPLFPDASHFFAPLVITLAVISIVYGALLAIGQSDIKRLIAYSSVSHFGFIVLGIFAMTTQGQSGSTLYMINHGFATAALFLVAGFLITRRGSRLIAHYGGVQKVAPVLAGTFLFAGLANLSLPGMSTFVSEFLVLVGTYTRYNVAAIVAVSGGLLASLYVLILYQRTMTGPVKEGNEGTPDLKARELLVVAPLMAVILALGVYPKPVLDIVNPAVDKTLQDVGAQDPDPTAPVAHEEATR